MVGAHSEVDGSWRVKKSDSDKVPHLSTLSIDIYD